MTLIKQCSNVTASSKVKTEKKCAILQPDSPGTGIGCPQESGLPFVPGLAALVAGWPKGITAGLEVPILDDPTRAKIDAHLPDYATSQNPVDGTAGSIRTIGYSVLANNRLY